jgi:hypothetical protein
MVHQLFPQGIPDEFTWNIWQTFRNLCLLVEPVVGGSKCVSVVFVETAAIVVRTALCDYTYLRARCASRIRIGVRSRNAKLFS